MKDETVVTCRKCGLKHYMKPDGMGDIMTVYCCGQRLQAPVKGKTSTKTSTNRKKKKD